MKQKPNHAFMHKGALLVSRHHVDSLSSRFFQGAAAAEEATPVSGSAGFEGFPPDCAALAQPWRISLFTKTLHSEMPP